MHSRNDRRTLYGSLAVAGVFALLAALSYQHSQTATRAALYISFADRLTQYGSACAAGTRERSGMETSHTIQALCTDAQ